MLSISAKEDTLALNSNVDIAFMMDATASMGANIARAKANIAEIVENVKNAFKDNVIRMGFVAYRDYTEGSGRIETFDFTDDIVKFSENLGKIKAERGADYPEDVLGGINATLGLNWQAPNKLFFQIGNNHVIFSLATHTIKSINIFLSQDRKCHIKYLFYHRRCTTKRILWICRSNLGYI